MLYLVLMLIPLSFNAVINVLSCNQVSILNIQLFINIDILILKGKRLGFSSRNYHIQYVGSKVYYRYNDNIYTLPLNDLT